MKLAIFLPNWIGDVVMATPTLRAVRDEFPSAEIVGIMRPYVADVLAGTGLVDRALFYNLRGNEPSQRGWQFVRNLRAERFDTALVLPNSLRTAGLAWLSGAKCRVGFARDLRGWLLTDRVVPKSKKTPHPVHDEYLRLAEQMGCRTASHRIELAVLPEDQIALDTFWSLSGERKPPGSCRSGEAIEEPGGVCPTLRSALAEHRRSVVCLNSGGAFGAAKNWPREHFGELGRRIADELGKTVLVVCGPSEREDARWIAANANHPAVVSLADAPLSIGLTKAAIREADLLVTTDSGPRHFAAAFGTPVITLFGPTHIAWSETNYDRAEHLQLKLDCGPCQQRECPLKHHRCMKELSVGTVFAAVQRRLARHDQTRAA
jgi:heptosyltransferase II